MSADYNVEYTAKSVRILPLTCACEDYLRMQFGHLGVMRGRDFVTSKLNMQFIKDELHENGYVQGTVIDTVPDRMP